MRVQFLAQSNKWSFWWSYNSWLTDYDSDTLPTEPYVEKWKRWRIIKFFFYGSTRNILVLNFKMHYCYSIAEFLQSEQRYSRLKNWRVLQEWRISFVITKVSNSLAVQVYSIKYIDKSAKLFLYLIILIRWPGADTYISNRSSSV